jgi:hypothetical protein
MKRIRFKKESQVLKLTTDRREYKILSSIDQDPYPDRGYWKFHTTKSPKTDSNWKRRKELTPFEVRMYRTWKYNRKTQWKNGN